MEERGRWAESERVMCHMEMGGDGGRGGGGGGGKRRRKPAYGTGDVKTESKLLA